MKPTIKDIAKRAKVSTATVSRVINGLEGYNEETKEKVLKAIEELGYKRNSVGIENKISSSKTVGVILPDISTNFYASIIKGIEDVALNNDYSVIMCNTGADGFRTKEYIDVLKQRNIDSIILIGISIKDEYYKALKELDVPYIQISTMSYKYQIPYIKVDSQQAAYAATQYLIDKGHEKIAMISGDAKDAENGHHRIFGFKQAMIDNGLEINEKLIKQGDFSYESGINCMKQLLEEGENFTAIFSASDDMAIGALQVAYENNISIPNELSIIGYDNTRVAQMSIPPLTTVSQPLYNMGVRGMKEIVNFIENGKGIESIIMPYTIIERKTVKKIK
ncbi:MAG: LacI family DNA-binding transcriptional regulator [Clostridium celatum]|mgnify:CR=1 FL=1|nr:LacI family DNA-binding transcriptional regulator [Clostridium celatum]MDU4978138.1 LacI family DNA-binding transcriptional regulator [Clostridium celatum]